MTVAPIRPGVIADEKDVLRQQVEATAMEAIRIACEEGALQGMSIVAFSLNPEDEGTLHTIRRTHRADDAPGISLLEAKAAAMLLKSAAE